MNRSVFLRTIVVVLGALLPTFAHAHAGLGEAGGFLHGLTHPTSGLDHVCAMLAVGLFALWHGHAHGAEMPALASGIDYALGFMLATALLHVIGIAFGLGMQRRAREHVIRAAGASIALCGMYLSAA